LGELVFVGLGLFDERDISRRGINAIERSDFVFAESYTSIMPGFSVENFERLVGKDIVFLSRRDLEDGMGETILGKAMKGRVTFLVSGDPLVATTHIDLRIRAEMQGIRTRVIHGVSIISAAVSASGLQNYRFGKSVTVPFSIDGKLSEIPLNTVAENQLRNLHTLCFLDINVEKNRFMTINEALLLLTASNKKGTKNVISLDSLAIGLARIGSENETVKADYIKVMLGYDYGKPPHLLIFPAERLHFMEAEALIRLAEAPDAIRDMIK